LIYYLWPILWMGVIFIFSTDLGSSAHTSHYVDSVVRFFYPDVPGSRLLLFQEATRKLAHLSEYAVLSILWFSAFSQGSRRWSFSHAGSALLICVVYAALDEFHQSFVPSRTASLTDVGIDSVGTLISLLFLFVRLRRSGEPSFPRPIPGER